MKHFLGSLIIAVLAAFVFSAIGYAWVRYDMQKLSDEVTTLQETVEELQNNKPPLDPSNQPITGNSNTNTTTNKNTNVSIGTNSNNTNGNSIQPVQNPGGVDVKEHDVYVTRSDDPTSFADSTELVFDMGSVPEAVLLTQDSAAGDAGDLLMYFPSFKDFSGPGDEKIMAAKSTDNGETWEELGLITLEDAIDGVTAVDPSLIQLDDGRLRMYFYGSKFVAGGDPAQAEGDHNIYSAVSDDGLTFTMEDGVRWAQEKITDPDVVYRPESGTWLMYVSEGPKTHIISSNDGLDWFDSEFDWDGGGVAGAYVDEDGTVHLYGCGQGGIMTEASPDGIVFDGTPTTALSTADQSIICDPSPVLLDDGTVLMVYKKAPTN